MRAKAYIVHRAMCAPELEWSKPKDCLLAEPLYAKREWQGLTDAELLEIYGFTPAPNAPDFIHEGAKQEIISMLRQVEAKLKEKNGL